MITLRLFSLYVLLVLNVLYSPGQSSLKQAFAGEFLVGAALNDQVVSGKDPGAAAIAEQQFNSVTAENVMKWAPIHPEPEKYDFDAADRFVAFGLKNKMFIVGHTLIWHAQIPKWTFVDKSGNMLDRDAMLARMKDHIFTVVGRYKGKVNGWDVVNEALEDDGTMRQSGWMKTIGEDFVAKAFEYAHEADPDAQLYYNEYSCEKPAKRDGILRLVRGLKAKGLRIDGVGIQGHWGMDYPPPDDFHAFVDSMASVGMKVMVTELDIDILPRAFDYMGADISKKAELKKELNPWPDGLPDSMQTVLAKRYVEIFTMLLDHPKEISRVTFWGVTDGPSWLNYWPVQGRTSYPLLFDREYRPKTAFYELIKLAGSKK